MDMDVTLDEHPLLDAACFSVSLERPLSEHPSPDWLLALLDLDVVRERGPVCLGGWRRDFPTARPPERQLRQRLLRSGLQLSAGL